MMSERGVLVWAQKNGGPRPSDVPDGSRRRRRGARAAAPQASDGVSRKTGSSDVGDGPLAPAPAASRAAERGARAGAAPAHARASGPRARAATGRANVATPRLGRRGVGRLGWRGILAVAAFAGAAGALLSAGAHAGGVAFSGRIAAGCDELAECQSLESEAERRASECLVFCGRAAAEHRAARLMRYRVEERLAVRDHYRARERAEQLEQERARVRALDERQRRDSARAEEAAREQRERLELEQLRQAHVDRHLADERQRRVGYYAALGPEGRARRLERCLGQSESCDTLVLDLLEAARDDDERRALAQSNERMTPPPVQATALPPSATGSSAREATPASHAAHTAARHPVAVEHSAADGDGPGDGAAPAAATRGDDASPPLPASVPSS